MEASRSLRITSLVVCSLVFAAGCIHPHYQGPVIDVHTHVFAEADKNSLNPKIAAEPGTLVPAMDRANVQRAGIITIARKGDLEGTRRENDHLDHLVKQYPERFFAIGSVHPDDGEEAIAELDRIARLGFKGLKLHPITQHLDVASANVKRVVERAGELGMVVLFDGWNPFDANQTGKFAALATSLPKARIIVAHMGGSRFVDMIVFKALEMYSFYPRNVWFDLSGVSHFFAHSPFADQLRWTCRQVGIDRVLFGSDFPTLFPDQAIADVVALGFTLDEQRRIFYDNAAALFP